MLDGLLRPNHRRSAGKPTKMRIEEAADILAFMSYSLGMKARRSE